MAEADGSNMICVGRYGFAAGEGFEVVSRAGSIYRVETSTHSESPAEVLQQHARGSGVLGRADLGTGRQAVWLDTGAVGQRQRTLLAAQAADKHSLLLKAVAEAGREAAAEKLVRNVFDAYRPNVVRGFCIGNGSITSEPSRNERASVMVKSSAMPDLELVVEIQTVAAPRENHPLSDIDQEARSFASIGTQLRVLKNELRSVAEMQGHEGQVEMSSKQEGVILRYTWFHAGTAARADDPEIMLRASAPLARKQSLDGSWSLLLSTFRLLPQ